MPEEVHVTHSVSVMALPCTFSGQCVSGSCAAWGFSNRTAESNAQASKQRMRSELMDLNSILVIC